MARGLVWLSLLAVFAWLAWAGWNEYQKLEVYRTWAEQFDRSKYDIYAVLGQKGSDLTWGKPTRKGLVEMQTFSLYRVQAIQLKAGDRSIDLETIPDSDTLPDDLRRQTRSIALEFHLSSPEAQIRVPFTELPLAIQWGKYLQRSRQQLQLAPQPSEFDQTI